MSNTGKASAISSLPLTERKRLAPLAEASRLSGLSEDTLRRHHASKFVRLSPRRIAMRVEDALMLGSEEAD
jgi:hypothetical protein